MLPRSVPLIFSFWSLNLYFSFPVHTLSCAHIPGDLCRCNLSISWIGFVARSADKFSWIGEVGALAAVSDVAVEGGSDGPGVGGG